MNLASKYTSYLQIRVVDDHRIDVLLHRELRTDLVPQVCFVQSMREIGQRQRSIRGEVEVVLSSDRVHEKVVSRENVAIEVRGIVLVHEKRTRQC